MVKLRRCYKTWFNSDVDALGMALQCFSIFGFTLMEDDPPILNITAGLATLKRCDTVLAKGSEFNQKGEADIGRHRLQRSSASDRVDQSGILGVRICRLNPPWNSGGRSCNPFWSV